MDFRITWNIIRTYACTDINVWLPVTWNNKKKSRKKKHFYTPKRHFTLGKRPFLYISFCLTDDCYRKINILPQLNPPTSATIQKQENRRKWKKTKTLLLTEKTNIGFISNQIELKSSLCQHLCWKYRISMEDNTWKIFKHLNHRFNTFLMETLMHFRVFLYFILKCIRNIDID